MRSDQVRILLVEDHDDTLALMRRLLVQKGYFVITASSMAEALRAGDLNEFEILLTDLQLADGWGWTLVQRLRERGRNFQAVAVTGHGMRHHLDRSEHMGFCAHLTKPIDFNELLRTIEDCIAAGNGPRSAAS